MSYFPRINICFMPPRYPRCIPVSYSFPETLLPVVLPPRCSGIKEDTELWSGQPMPGTAWDPWHKRETPLILFGEPEPSGWITQTLRIGLKTTEISEWNDFKWYCYSPRLVPKETVTRESLSSNRRKYIQEPTARHEVEL